MHRQALAAAEGVSSATELHKQTRAYLEAHLPEGVKGDDQTSGLSRKDNRWSRGVAHAIKRLKKLYPDFRLLRERSDDRVTFVGFEKLFTDVTRGVDANDERLVHERACLLTAQCIMIGYFEFPWDKALRYAVAGMPPIPEGDGHLPWHEYVMRKIREMESVDERLAHSMHRFYAPPTVHRRVHSRNIDAHSLRTAVLAGLTELGLPDPLWEKEAQQSFNPCYGSGYPGNLEKVLEYYRPARSFGGDLALVEAASKFVASTILSQAGGSISRWTPEQAAAWLYVKTDGRTQVGGRMHTTQSALGPKGVETLIAHSKKLTSFTTRMPCEVGNRFVPAKNVYSEKDKWKIAGYTPKDRTTYAVYKAKQINDLTYIYPAQRVMAGMQWFVALAGHDATFNVSRTDNQIAMELYNALREFDSWGASWDFQAHDALFDVCMALLYGQGDFASCGIMPQLFPETPEDEWNWSYECSTHSTRFIEHGLLFTGRGIVHGADSGEGWTNGGESMVGAVMLTYSLLRSVQRVVGDDIYQFIGIDGFLDALVDSTVMMFMGDDTASVTNHPKFVSAINDALAKIGKPPLELDGVRYPTPEEAAADLCDFGTNPSTDARKISYFGRKSTERMFDFTAHQCYISFNDNGEVTKHIHGYYPFLRALASYNFAEARSPQEILVSAARFGDGQKVNIEDIFNLDVLSFFVALQYSILSNTYMNPGEYMVPIFKQFLRHVPHYGGFFAVAKDPRTVATFLKNMPVRESLTEQKLVNSRVFASLLEASAQLYEDPIDHPDEVVVLLDWVTGSRDTDLVEFATNADFPIAGAGWKQLFDMYPADSDPAGRKKVSDAKALVDEQVEDLSSAFAPRTFDSIMNCIGQMKGGLNA